MLYAHIVLGLPVAGPFDYEVPAALTGKIKIGSRVLVSFGPRARVVGFVVSFSGISSIRNLKPILDVLDDVPVLDRSMLELTKEAAQYYCCSWGEMIETSLPVILRENKRVLLSAVCADEKIMSGQPENILLHDPESRKRWEIYKEYIRACLGKKKSIIALFQDVSAVLKARRIFEAEFGPVVSSVYRKQQDEFVEWKRIKEGQARIAAGTRSAVFSPCVNLGLIIVDEESDSAYKQEQSPHYNARDIALMRARYEGASLIASASHPSTEIYQMVQEKKFKYVRVPKEKRFPDVKIFNMSNTPFADRKKKPVLSNYLQDKIAAALKKAGKVLIFLNRKGFATSAVCFHCGKVLQCERCHSNLIYHYYDKILTCRYCNFRIQPPKICPDCNSGYIKFSGIGTEKMESEIARSFPQARITRVESGTGIDLEKADVFVSTEIIIRETGVLFDLIGVLSIDNTLNRVDFRAGEKTFALLYGLANLTEKEVIVQTYLPNHYCFQALKNNSPESFFAEELTQRQQLKLPPFLHAVLVKARGRNDEKTRALCEKIFTSLASRKKTNIHVISMNRGQPTKLRGNYYWQVLVTAVDPVKASAFLKTELKNFSHSGIIITVDVDPI